MLTPAAIIVMSVTRSRLAPMLMAESESDPPSVVLVSIVVGPSSPESDDEGVGEGPGEGVGAVVVSPVSSVVSPLPLSSEEGSEGAGGAGGTVGIAPLIQVAQHFTCV